MGAGDVNRTVVCAVVLLAVGMIACGRGNGGASGERAVAPDVAAPRDQPRATPVRDGPEAERLWRALLSAFDLGGGWHPAQDARGAPEYTNICAANLATLERQGQKTAEVGASFEQSPSGPFVGQTLAAYPPGVAEQVLADLRAATRDCNAVSVYDPTEDSWSVWQLSPLETQTVGDESLAFRQSFPPHAVDAEVVYIRRGDAISVLVHVAIGERIDPRQTENMARRAEERMRQLDGQ
jgi:hypothetical protein